MFDPDLAIIEYYGPLIRIGVEGKWVEFILRPDGPKRKQPLLDLIEQMDRERPPTKIAPVFISEKGNLAFSRESDGKIRLVYPNWDDAKVVEPSEVLELRASSQGVCTTGDVVASIRDHGQSIPGGKRDDQVAMNYRLRAGGQDQAAIRRLREAIDGALDLARIAHVDSARLHPECRRHRLDDSELADTSR